MNSKISELAKKHLERMIIAREYLHENPELGHEEYLTQAYVESILNELGIENYRLAGTGVVGLIHGNKPGKTVLLRADMDALPIQEIADVPYKSKNEGKMHACGHDGHTAGLLGAAMILNELKDELNGTVKLMFQPAEETDGGALPMIEEGILENPKVDAAFGLHLAGHLPAGTLQVKYGAMYGAPDEFEITIHGRGGHAANPEQTIDPISIAMQFMSNAQNILTRRIDPMKPAVISFTKIHAGEGLNVIPETLNLGGTIRTLYPETRELVSQYVQETLKSICDLNGATYDFTFMPSYPPLINNDEMVAFAEKSLTKQFKDKVSQMEFATLGAEDFAYLAKYVPSSYHVVGIHTEGEPEPVHHHPAFAWDSSLLETTSASLAVIAYDFLTQ